MRKEKITLHEKGSVKAGKFQPSEKRHKDYSRYFLPSLLIITSIVFINSLGNGFVSVWDDQDYILNNELIKHLDWKNIRIIFSTFFQGNYHPLTLLFYAIEYRFYGLSPFAFHFSNYILHLFNVWLVYVFVKKISDKAEVAMITALFFGIHPMHVESVAWISETKDLLYTLFFLLALNGYLNYKKNKKENLFPFSVFFWFLLSLLSKPAAVCLPFVLLLIDYYQDKKIGWRMLVSKSPFFLVAFLFGVLALSSQGGSGAIQDIALLYNVPERFFLVCYSIVFYLVKAFVPIDFCALHYYPKLSGGLLPFQYYLALPLLLLMLVAIFRSKSFKKELIFGLLFYLVTIGMVLQVVPFGRTIVSERYSYVPYIGVFFIVGQFVSQVRIGQIHLNPTLKRIMSVALIIMVIICSVQTWQRNKIWKDGIRLFSDVIEKYPQEGFGWDTRGECKSLENDFEGANADFSKAIDVNNANAEVWFKRGAFYLKFEKLEPAVIDFNNAIRLKPDYYQAFCNRGLAFINLNKINNAINDFNRTIDLRPDFADAWFNRGNAFYGIQKFEKAISDYTMVTQLNPNYAKAWFNRGIAKLSMKDAVGACSDWHAAQKLGHTQAGMALQAYCH